VGVVNTASPTPFFKRNAALAYYRLLAWLGIEVVGNHADSRLMSRRAVDAVLQYPEVSLFGWGQFLFPPDAVSYERP
jgi:hypothetical protein